ncbi:hypothetical protein [Affinirhizobium pseudoryzae]|uniref:hypothetical protein n=1 Tax=Allorhizobium pseudoryzae TaxID=379684 RepID=UPI0013EC3B7F|nr:hypothetical protein [Allorhizobium pseudoryzae]
MLQKNRRYVLYFDLSMAPHPADAPPIDLAVVLPELKKRCDNGVAVETIDAERRIIRLSNMAIVKLADGSDGMAMLFCLGDREKADTGVTNVHTGKVRIFEKDNDEVGGLSVHVVARMTPATPGSFFYRMVMEDVPGFGRTLIQNFLRSQFRVICDELSFTFKRNEKSEVKTRPMVELVGHASEKLKNSIAEGRLLHVELIDYVEQDFGFDEAKFIKQARKNLNLSISKKLPEGDQLSMVEKIKVWAKGAGYESMRVRWKDPESTKPQSAKLDTAKQDAGEAFFIRTAEVKFTTPLPDICETMSGELVTEMKKLLV